MHFKQLIQRKKWCCHSTLVHLTDSVVMYNTLESFFFWRKRIGKLCYAKNYHCIIVRLDWQTKTNLQSRLLAPTSRPIVKKLQKRGYKSYLAMKFPKSCIHIGNSLDIYSFYFVLILIHMDSELARKSYCRTTYRAPLGQTLDSKHTLFAGKFQQRGQVRVYHISQGNNLFSSQQ